MHKTMMRSVNNNAVQYQLMFVQLLIGYCPIFLKADSLVNYLALVHKPETISLFIKMARCGLRHLILLSNERGEISFSQFI